MYVFLLLPQPSLPGFGVYHSGLMVYGTEYTFAGSIVAGTGVQSQRPEWQPDVRTDPLFAEVVIVYSAKVTQTQSCLFTLHMLFIPCSFLFALQNSPWVFDRSVPLGKTSLSKRDVQALVDVLKREFPATSYNLTTRNCNHFTETMTLRLGLKYPSWVNRASNTISSIPLVNKMAADRSAPKAADGLAPPDSQTQEQIRAQLDKPLTEQKDLCVNDRIDVSRAGVLNAAKPSSVQQCLRPASVDSKAAARLQRGVFSDADEQMIIILPMKTPQRITALEFTVDAANPGTCPKRIKVYRNMPNVDFSSVEGKLKSCSGIITFRVFFSSCLHVLTLFYFPYSHIPSFLLLLSLLLPPFTSTSPLSTSSHPFSPLSYL